MAHKLLIDLDSLFDTRMATVALIDQNAAKELISEKYTGRHSDELWMLTDKLAKDEYLRAYRERTKLTLSISYPTEMLVVISKTIEDLERTSIRMQPVPETNYIDLNIYPYELTDDEKEEYKRCLKEVCGTVTVVNIVNIPLADLTFEEIHARAYTGIYMYHAREWAEQCFPKHYPNGKLPTIVLGTRLFTPALVPELTRLAKSDQLKLPNGQFLDPFEAVTTRYAENIGFEFLNPSAFSQIGLPGGHYDHAKNDQSIPR